MQVLVINERDHLGEEYIIGISDSVKQAESLIDEYYGEFKEIHFTDVRDSGIEYSKVIEDTDGDRYRITLEWFEINKI